MKSKSIEAWSRSRQFRSKTNTKKFNDKTESGKISAEYHNILQLGANNPSQGVVEYLKRCEELK